MDMIYTLVEDMERELTSCMILEPLSCGMHRG
jgi:hypothetical protein